MTSQSDVLFHPKHLQKCRKAREIWNSMKDQLLMERRQLELSLAYYNHVRNDPGVPELISQTREALITFASHAQAEWRRRLRNADMMEEDWVTGDITPEEKNELEVVMRMPPRAPPHAGNGPQNSGPQSYPQLDKAAPPAYPARVWLPHPRAGQEGNKESYEKAIPQPPKPGPQRNATPLRSVTPMVEHLAKTNKEVKQADPPKLKEQDSTVRTQSCLPFRSYAEFLRDDPEDSLSDAALNDFELPQPDEGEYLYLQETRFFDYWQDVNVWRVDDYWRQVNESSARYEADLKRGEGRLSEAVKQARLKRHEREKDVIDNKTWELNQKLVQAAFWERMVEYVQVREAREHGIAIGQAEARYLLHKRLPHFAAHVRAGMEEKWLDEQLPLDLDGMAIKYNRGLNEFDLVRKIVARQKEKETRRLKYEKKADRAIHAERMRLLQKFADKKKKGRINHPRSEGFKEEVRVAAMKLEHERLRGKPKGDNEIHERITDSQDRSSDLYLIPLVTGQ
ncbi:hypothetical protein EWM64_g6035 [Hericium alpestre]|uniref:Uncharacterized protein n=1 Tax=Hericium alpestre TaxID=135208 RepID=A0A4Y9ZSV9_9AGAM|nr:hypothetical protein EWM64_g6035 [Hericium alpestre]